MKNKLIRASLLLSTTLLFVPQLVQAETSEATVSFTGDDTTPTKPLDPTDPGDPTNPGTGSAGPLSLDYVSNFDFGTNQIPSSTQTYTAKAQYPRVQVTDKRGTGAGWEVQANISPIASADDETLKGANIILVSREVVTSPGNTSTKPTTSDITLKANDQTVFSATKDTGMGT